MELQSEEVKLNRYDAYPYAVGAGTGISISIGMVTGFIYTMELIKWLL